MPTPQKAYAAVANMLADVDPADARAVTMFYRRAFLEYPISARTLIADFLAGQTAEPTGAALKALQTALTCPVDDLPTVEAPQWDTRFGPAMQYEPADRQEAAAG